MVLGLKSKHKKDVNFLKVEYIIHVNEIRPWPPSESLKSVQTVLLQWENGTESSGTFLSVAGNSNIAFNESFILPLVLSQKKSSNMFRKNYLEFSLFEPRKEKSTKGQHLLGTASLNLADYALFDELLNIDVPFSFKKSSDSWGPPALSISLELIERDSSNSSPSVGFSKRTSSLDGDSEIASLTDYDDDVASSHSSRTGGSSTFEIPIASPSRVDLSKERSRYSKPPSSDSSSDTWHKVKDLVSLSKLSERSLSYVKKSSSANAPMVISSPISVSYSDNERLNSILESSRRESRNVLFENQYSNSSSTNTQQTVEDKFLERFAVEAMLEHHKKNYEKSSPLNEKFSEDSAKREVTSRSETHFPNRNGHTVPPSGSNKARLKHMNSVKIQGSPKGSETKGDFCDGQNVWRIRAEMLEEELRETAAIEVALYAAVTEHSSSVNKVHAPARRLSRFYINACRVGSQAKRASAARAAISGFVTVSKACRNDVPRMTFWLSNAIMLRSIVSQTASELPQLNGPKEVEESDDFEDILTLIMALEKVESWLFSRIVESVWWQAFTPHMLPALGKGCHGDRGRSTKKTNGKRNYLGDHEQGSFSIELWKKAFRDACERICPVRAVGHECGCLSVLVTLVMEQLVNRLDVAMLNAILRESGEEMPTDPVSDPIGDCKVLPIPAGKSSFGAGAQLKNVIGNWSRWLSDLFGIDDDLIEDSVVPDSGTRPKSFKAFCLLHSLSDLMMLPFGNLANVSTRKKVCPMFGPAIIKRVLSNFVPDEFSPSPIPRYIINALNSEEISEPSHDLITSFPFIATPTKYSPPPAALLTCVGEVGSQVLKSSRLSTLKKSYTSDDDLDELDNPLTSVIPESYQNSSALSRLSLMPKEKGGRDIVRYNLLREIWRDDDE